MPQPDNDTKVLPVLQQGQGSIAFQLLATASSTDEILNVQVGHCALYQLLMTVRTM